MLLLGRPCRYSGARSPLAETRAVKVISRRTYSIQHGRKSLLTLAIESSCDDTSVAILEKRAGKDSILHFHEKITAHNEDYNGIHPIVALESHQSTLASLVQKAIKALPPNQGTSRDISPTGLSLSSHGTPLRQPDFISATRGPGMRSNLSVGLDTAKGLAVAWDIPLIGVHHMQAHALTPRLVNALSQKDEGTQESLPGFPFVSLLVSGGHSMLLSSTSVTEHRILASTGDIALGDCLDKAARVILPDANLKLPYGRALEEFAFPNGAESYGYQAPHNRAQELQRRKTEWGWSFGPPLADGKGGRSSKRMEYSFSGLLTAVERFLKFELDPRTGSPTSTIRAATEISVDERRVMAREVQRVAFEHLVSRVLLHLQSLSPEQRSQVKTVVVSGGVAANSFMRHVFRAMLDVRGHADVQLCFPPIELCTDNAAMIAWAGCEMFEAGWRSELSIRPIRKWSLDHDAEDGGILGVDGWINVDIVAKK